MNGGEGAPTYSGYQQQELVPYETSTRLDVGNMYNATSVDSPSEAEVAVCFLNMKEGKGQERTTRGRARAPRTRARAFARRPRAAHLLRLALFILIAFIAVVPLCSAARAFARASARRAPRPQRVARALKQSAWRVARGKRARTARARPRACASRVPRARARGRFTDIWRGREGRSARANF